MVLSKVKDQGTTNATGSDAFVKERNEAARMRSGYRTGRHENIFLSAV